MTHIEELREKWMKNPKFRAEYEALHLEFELIRGMIHARVQSGLTQAQIAERMGTTQSAVARLESGRSNPSAKTLEKYAKATGTRLRIGFEPIEADAPQGGNGTAEDVATSDVMPVEYEDKEQVPIVT